MSSLEDDFFKPELMRFILGLTEASVGELNKTRGVLRRFSLYHILRYVWVLPTPKITRVTRHIKHNPVSGYLYI